MHGLVRRFVVKTTARPGRDCHGQRWRSRAALVAALSLEIVRDEFVRDGQRTGLCAGWAVAFMVASRLAAHLPSLPGTTSARDAVTRDYLGRFSRGFLVPFPTRAERYGYGIGWFPWRHLIRTPRIRKPFAGSWCWLISDTGTSVIGGYYPRLPMTGTSVGVRANQNWRAMGSLFGPKTTNPYSLSLLQRNGERPNWSV